ncbi:MAG: beta-ketoacyl-ACP synthase II [Bacteroidales bacterium]|nr:beta-ketoacyl-ACP synthase II [Bacteroidales bacterium]
MELKRVVVTGLGALTPIGLDLASFWSGLTNGVSGASLITRFDPEQFKCKIACELKGYDLQNYFEKKEGNKLDLFTQYGIIAADEAIADSALLQDAQVDRSRIGVIWGSGMGGVRSFQDEAMEYQRNGRMPRFSPFLVPRTITDICAGYISIKHGLKGANYVTTAACASSGVAIADAFDAIRLGKAVAVVTGGSEAAVTEIGIGGFSSMRALSTRNDDPQTASRPFDKDRDGFVLGEGAAALVLEEYEHARARGARIYAEVTGYGLTADAHHITAPHPEGKGAQEAMRLAIEESGMSPNDVDHINTHGTSTPLGDKAETTAIVNLFGDHAADIAVNSTKSMTGHMLGAAGAAEATAAILAIFHDIVPPTINHFTDDEDLPQLNYTFGTAAHRPVRFALSNAFGFGGHNVSLAFRKM